ncbi:hypothetical protein L596_009648 [Steinernema carpocapsae]|uniref:F-box domain-containing protein n=1 Tax=Steinernema carpocapsae TaxID=34508 RepID=A0A4U5PGG9_STECR|nr:hypothetical protein L596_009648 [Steinernema carpocapsae]
MMDQLPERAVDAIIGNLPCFTTKKLFNLPGVYGDVARDHISMSGDLYIDIAFYADQLIFTCQVESLATMERTILQLDNFDPDYIKFLRVGELRIASFPRFSEEDYVTDPQSFQGLLYILANWRPSVDRTSQLQLANITPNVEQKLAPLMDCIGIGFDEIVVIRSTGPVVHRFVEQQVSYGCVKRVQLAESNIKPYEMGFQDAMIELSQQSQMRQFIAETINFDFVRRLAREWKHEMRFSGTNFSFTTSMNTWEKLRSLIEGMVHDPETDEWLLSTLRDNGVHEELRFQFITDEIFLQRGTLRIYEIEF